MGTLSSGLLFVVHDKIKFIALCLLRSAHEILHSKIPVGCHNLNLVYMQGDEYVA